MGGMQVLQWAASYPQRVFAALPIAAATRHSAQNIAFHEVGRQAVMADPDWRGGRYFVEGINPRRGLAVARMGAHITYLSEPRCTGNSAAVSRTATIRHSRSTPIPGRIYLRHQGITFVERFDANSYLYLTRAMDYFDLAADYDGVVANAFLGTHDALLRDLVHQRLAVPDAGIRAIVHALNAAGARVSLLKSRPTRGMTHSCSTSRNCLRSCAVSWKGRRGAHAAGAEIARRRTA